MKILFLALKSVKHLMCSWHFILPLGIADLPSSALVAITAALLNYSEFPLTLKCRLKIEFLCFSLRRLYLYPVMEHQVSQGSQVNMHMHFS